MHIPKISPVVVLHLKADNDANGNPRRAFAILDTRGRLVEVLDEGYKGDGELHARYPWTSGNRCIDLDLTGMVFPVVVEVAPKEYRRWLQRTPDGATAGILRLAEYCQRRARREGR